MLEHFAIDFNLILDKDFIISMLPLFQKAFFLTLEISFYGISFAILLGFVIALIVYYRIPYLFGLSRVYIEISRNTPLIIQLFFLYFGLAYWVEISNFWCAIIGVTFLGSSYMAESFRLGFVSIKDSQIESALSLGLSKIQILKFIIFPQSITLALPSICANVLFLIKETSIIGVIGLQDLMSVTKEIIGNYGQTNEALFMLIIAYLVVLLPLSFLFSWLEYFFRKYVL
ncbi:polar amino acid ABC transporter permease [Helicobacter didelphidarum]|uniref:Polar amino acid ABC transporter permease n=1 Tax=Helicobacter didelphidarum TaxID=2040648 RepID=A0A3D8ISE2_9HELI|nr:amino acid ABC transporter permease [Helicobacter didelphidarum]RDU67511.1 polar amino acid ABC transporter permease [Helicobacter didelphidarum]